MPDDTNTCKPLSVRVTLKRSDTQKIEFSLAKSCKKVEEKFEAVWTIHFALLEKDGEDYTAKIAVDIDLNKDAPGKEKKAEDTANGGVSENQTLYLLGPVSRAADKAGEDPFAAEIERVLTGENQDFRALTEDEATEELLGRIADERGKNIQRLRARVVSVLDVK